MKPNEMTDQELSEVIAIEVMGWEKETTATEHAIVDYWTVGNGILTRECFNESACTEWNPVHDLNQAWEAEEYWLKENGEWDFGIYRRWQGEELCWVVWMTKEIGAEINIEAENTNPARAICEALISAVREEQG